MWWGLNCKLLPGAGPWCSSLEISRETFRGSHNLGTRLSTWGSHCIFLASSSPGPRSLLSLILAHWASSTNVALPPWGRGCFSGSCIPISGLQQPTTSNQTWRPVPVFSRMRRARSIHEHEYSLSLIHWFRKPIRLVGSLSEGSVPVIFISQVRDQGERAKLFSPLRPCHFRYQEMTDDRQVGRAQY